MDGAETIQTEPIFLSSNEDTTSQCLTSDIYLMGIYGNRCDTLNHFIDQPNEPLDSVRVIISKNDLDLQGASTSITSVNEAYSAKSPYNFSEITTRYLSQ